MIVHHKVKGYDEFKKLMSQLEDKGQVIRILFSGGKDENGLSWCPYCVQAEPIVSDLLTNLTENSHFVYVDVGERTYWKDLNCPFRKDPSLKLVFLPTIMRWNTPQRLDGERCINRNLVEMIFEEV